MWCTWFVKPLQMFLSKCITYIYNYAKRGASGRYFDCLIRVDHIIFIYGTMYTIMLQKYYTPHPHIYLHSQLSLALTRVL